MSALTLLQGDDEGVSTTPIKPVLTQVKHVALRHHFTKVEGTWTCPCGATADRYGKVQE